MADVEFHQAYRATVEFRQHPAFGIGLQIQRYISRKQRQGQVSLPRLRENRKRLFFIQERRDSKRRPASIQDRSIQLAGDQFRRHNFVIGLLIHPAAQADNQAASPANVVLQFAHRLPAHPGDIRQNDHVKSGGVDLVQLAAHSLNKNLIGPAARDARRIDFDRALEIKGFPFRLHHARFALDQQESARLLDGNDQITPVIRRQNVIFELGFGQPVAIRADLLAKGLRESSRCHHGNRRFGGPSALAKKPQGSEFRGEAAIGKALDGNLALRFRPDSPGAMLHLAQGQIPGVREAHGNQIKIERVALRQGACSNLLESFSLEIGDQVDFFVVTLRLFKKVASGRQRPGQIGTFPADLRRLNFLGRLQAGNGKLVINHLRAFRGQDQGHPILRFKSQQRIERRPLGPVEANHAILDATHAIGIVQHNDRLGPRAFPNNAGPGKLNDRFRHCQNQ